jgi:AraC-like DNA-binding protein
MVSLRCKMMVKEQLQKLGIHYNSVEIGMAELAEDLTQNQRDQLKMNLLQSGLELLEDKRNILIEQIKNSVTEMIHEEEEVLMSNNSDYISKKLHYNYTYLSNVFSEIKGITIQQYIILHKIECVKELLIYDELSLTQIAYKMHYSSVAHLSNQFKKITGLTPSYFKRVKVLRQMKVEEM